METEMQGWAPIGVVAAIVPWNFPLMLLSWKVHVYMRGGRSVKHLMYYAAYIIIQTPCMYDHRTCDYNHLLWVILYM